MGGVTSNCSRAYNSNDKPTSDGTTSATPPERGSENGNGNASSGNSVARHGSTTAATTINGVRGTGIDHGDVQNEISTEESHAATNATPPYDDGKRRHSMPGCGGVRTELSRMSTANRDGKDHSSGCSGEAIDTDTRIMRRIASTSAHRHQQRSSPLNTSGVGVFGKAPSRHNPLVAAAGRTSSTGSSCSSSGGPGSKRGSFDNGGDSPRDCTNAIAPCVTTIGCNGVRIEAAADSLNNDVINRWRRSETTGSGSSNDGRFDSPATSKCGVRFEPLTSGGSCSPSNSGMTPGNNMAAVGSRSQQRRRSSIAFLPTYGGGVPAAPATSITTAGSGGLFPLRPSCLTAGGSGGGPPISPMDRVNIGFGNATDLVANLISAASGGSGTAGARSPGPTKMEDQFWVPPTVWRKKRAQSLVPQKLSAEGSVAESE
jgi:hypothetical protein